MPERDRVRIIAYSAPTFTLAREITGWQEVEITRRYATASGSFRLKASPARGLALAAGDKVEIFLGPSDEDLAATGFVDADIFDISDRTTLTVWGRDPTADLIDCVPPKGTQSSWFQANPLDIVRDIAKGFGVTVTGNPASSLARLIPAFSRNAGEKGWASCERALRIHGHSYYVRNDGALEILTVPVPGRAEADLIMEGGGTDVPRSKFGGVPVKSCQISRDHSNRFSTYIARGRVVTGFASFGQFGAYAAPVEGLCTDPAIGRVRPFEIIGDSALTTEEADQRAQFEATVRAVRAFSATCVVQGWRQGPNGPLWAINQHTHLQVPEVNISEKLFVDGVTFKQSGQGGSTTTLSLVRQDAYVTTPVLREEPAQEPEPPQELTPITFSRVF